MLIESKTCCVRGIQRLHEQTLYEEHIVELHIRDTVQAFPIHLRLRRTYLAVFYDKNVVANLEVLRTHVRLVVVILNSIFEITRSFLCHLCVNLHYSL
jgi:hypothetical protein